jgi:hypothetical protein
VPKQLRVSLGEVAGPQPLPCFRNTHVTVKPRHDRWLTEVDIAVQQMLVVKQVILHLLDVLGLDPGILRDLGNVVRARPDGIV